MIPANIMPLVTTTPPAAVTPDYQAGYKAACEQFQREIDNLLGTARNRNEYQHGRIDTLHDLRSLLKRRLADL